MSLDKGPSRRMPHLFQPAGEAVLARVMPRRPLVAFDFDGTLAPIVARPERARVSGCVAGKLARLSRRVQVAIVTGRSVADVRGRLGFEPDHVVGNHGAEFAGADAGARRALDPVRLRLAGAAQALHAAGVGVEDKAYSLALHYRLSRDPAAAQRLIGDTLQGLEQVCNCLPGKKVVNVVSPDAPDKWDAVRVLTEHCGAPCAVFVGDDLNDEPVFAAAPPDWLTVRVGRDHAESQARFFLDSTAEVGMLLDRMLHYAGDGALHAP
jgi:trehalose 6-phosphate phosphatase